MKRIMSRLMRMMGKRTCEDVVAVLHDYFDGRLEPRLTAIISAHLEECPNCHAFARTYGAVVRLTGELPVDEVPEEVCIRVRQALRERYGH